MKWGFFLLILICRPAAATEICSNLARSLMPLLQKVSIEQYHPLTCSDNVEALIEEMNENGWDLSQAKVLHIRHLYMPHVPVYALKQRLRYKENTYKPTSWTFHAILVFKGFVLDFDYTDQLQVISFDNYMDQMWGEKRFTHKYQIKPALLYGGRDTYGLMKVDTYPVVNFEDIKSLIEAEDCASYSY